MSKAHRTPEGLERQRARDREVRRKEFAENHDAVLERQRQRRLNETPEQRERRLATIRAWQAAHPDAQRAWRDAHPGYNAERQAAARAKDPDAVRRTVRKHRLKSKYGLTIERYEELLAEQDGRCAICRRQERLVIKGTTCTLAVDHDHATARVRGLLCVNCNMAIGGLQHDPGLFRAAIAYLER